MNPIKVLGAPSEKDRDAFAAQVKNQISKVANLCGWDREEREVLMGAVETSSAVTIQWVALEEEAQPLRTLPIWKWNHYARNATDDLVASFYSKG